MSGCEFSLSRGLDAVAEGSNILLYLTAVQWHMATDAVEEATYDKRNMVVRPSGRNGSKRDFSALEEFFRMDGRMQTARWMQSFALAARVDPSRARKTWIRAGGMFFRRGDRAEVIHLANKGATGHEVLLAQEAFMEAHPRMFKR